MNILLVGGTGVLSSAVTMEALKWRINVTMINRGHHPIPQNVELIKADKDDIETIGRFLENHDRFDAIVDFLCYTPADLERSYRLYSTFADQYVFISSCAVYNKDLIDGMANEDSPRGLEAWDYSMNKKDCEDLLMCLSEELKTPYTIVRPCVTYDNTRIPYGIMPRYGYHWTLIERIRHNKPVIVWNNGENRCNMMRVEDFATGLVGLLGRSQAYNACFNICGDETPAFNEVLSIIEDEMGIKARRMDIPADFYAEVYPERSGELLGGRSRNSVNSNSKIKNLVPEFGQKINLQAGVRMSLASYKNPPHQRGIDWAFDAEWDYVISAWCKTRGISKAGLNLKLIDYGNKLTVREKLVYWSIYYKDRFFPMLLIKGFKLLYKIFDRLKVVKR